MEQIGEQATRATYDRLIILRVWESTKAGVQFTFNLLLDDEVLTPNLELTTEQLRTVQELSHEYGQLFEPERLSQLTRAVLSDIGVQLFQLWFAPHWPRLSTILRPSEPRKLVIASPIPAVLNLPWELLKPPEDDAIGVNALWGLRRLPWVDRNLNSTVGNLLTGPLRALYIAAAPLGETEFDFELEEELLLYASGKAGQYMAFDSGDLGTFEELRERIYDFRPHVVHLTGHCVLREETPYFLFEDDYGRSDERGTVELGKLFVGSGVQCAFISACRTHRGIQRAALAELARGLLAEGVPMVIGWTALIVNDVAAQLAGVFYSEVATGQTVDRALAVARRAVQSEDDPSWFLAILYAGTRQSFLFDHRRMERGARRSLVMRPLPGMIEGYDQYFIGRRRELQRLLPSLRSGKLQVVALTGLGGTGKSALATRIARKLEIQGWTLLALSSNPGTPLSAGQLLQSCGDAFLTAGQRELYAILCDASLSVADRLRQVVTGLNRGRFVLVLGNFENNLERDGRRILNAELARFYSDLLNNLIGGSRVIITSRYLPSDVDPLPATVREEQLGEFGESAFLKFLLRNEVVARRYRLPTWDSDHLPHDLLVRLHQLFGALPGFLYQICAVLESMPATELRTELDRVALPSLAKGQAEQGRLQTKRNEYCTAIFTDRLYERLSPDMQEMLSRAAVYNLPVTLEGLVAILDLPEATVRQAAEQWRAAALVQVDRSGGRDLWSVYGMLRGWLLASPRLDSSARRAAHMAAGDFLVRLNAQDRERELGVTWVTCLLEARAQYLAANDLDNARKVTARISGYYTRQGLYAELEVLHADLLVRQEHTATHLWLGRAHESQGDFKEAQIHFERALALGHDRDPVSASEALSALAMIDVNEGSYDAAREKFEHALTMTRQIGDNSAEEGIWYNLATIDIRQGSYSAAREKLKRVITIAQEVGDHAGEATSWHNLAMIDLNLGEYSAARAKFERALSMRQRIGDRVGEAATLHNLATIDLREGSYPVAREKFERSLVMRREIGDSAGEATSWHQLATIALEEGDYSAARENFERSLAMCRQIDDRLGEAAALHQLATIDLSEGAYHAAREKFERVLAQRHRIGDRHGEAAAWHQLGTIDLREDGLPAAREKFERSLAIRRQIGDLTGESETWYQLATVDLREGSHGAARERFERALTMRQKMGDEAGEAAIRYNLASVDLREGLYDAAREKFEHSLTIMRQIGDQVGEAATWYCLATIDAHAGLYSAAREKSERALKIAQQTGNRVSEAATWHQLGFLAVREGNPVGGLRLLVLCYLLHRAIGHRDRDNDLEALAQGAFEQKMKIADLIAEVDSAYTRDRGLELLRQAFN